jgi:hypothetical protein
MIGRGLGGASIPLYGGKGGTRTKLMISMHASGKKIENTVEQLVKKLEVHIGEKI